MVLWKRASRFGNPFSLSSMCGCHGFPTYWAELARKGFGYRPGIYDSGQETLPCKFPFLHYTLMAFANYFVSTIFGMVGLKMVICGIIHIRKNSDVNGDLPYLDF